MQTYEQPDIDKTYLHVKHPFKLKFRLLIKGRKQLGIKRVKNPKAFTNYSQIIDDVYENLEDYNPTQKTRVLIVLDDMIADMESDKRLLSLTFTELFLRGRKPNISLVSTPKSYFKVPKSK